LVLAPVAVLAVYASPYALAALVAAAVALGAWEWARMCGSGARPGRETSACWLAIGGIVLAVAGLSVVGLRFHSGADAVMWLFGAVWATDIGAFAVGTSVGGPKVAPRVSPNKTWSGLAGGIACATLWSVAFQYLALHMRGAESLAEAAALGAVTAVVAQTGDFGVSFAKRRFGLKDSSGLIPGHGGVLDRIAGLLTTGPALALFLLAINRTA
jgi:phosphatidate cytidylyltransferase